MMTHDLRLNEVLGPDLGDDEAIAPRLSGLHSPAPSIMVITCQGHTDWGSIVHIIDISVREEKVIKASSAQSDNSFNGR